LPDDVCMPHRDNEMGIWEKGVHGYRSKQVVQDRRYRLVEALHGAGLQGHVHAQHMLAALPPQRVITQHLTTAQLARPTLPTW
jgi:hypothetical protein